VLYEMLAGQPPFTGATAEAIARQHVVASLPLVSLIRADVPGAIVAALQRALARAPADRYASAETLRDALQRAVAKGVQVTGDVPDPRGRTGIKRLPWRQRTTSSSLLSPRRALAAGLLTAVAGMTLWGVMSFGSTNARRWLGIARMETPSPRMTALAVLPFENLTGDPAQAYFVDGMHDAVTAELGRLNAFVVKSRTSAMRYRNSTLPMPDIARELEVDALLEGTVMRTDGRLRFTVRLIDGPTDRQLWVRPYTRDVRDVLLLHEEVAGDVARRIAGVITPAVNNAHAPPPDPEAYDHYQRGRYYMAQAPGALDSAIRHFEQAVAHDSSIARAHAGLAEAYWWQASTRQDLERPARNAAQKAIDLDPDLPEAHVAMGLVRLSAWDWNGSEAAFRKALQLNPNSSEAHRWLAQLLRQTGRLDEAMLEAQQALDLDPYALVVRAMVGWVSFNQRRYDEALEVWKGALELEPEFGLAIYHQGLVYWMKGMGHEVVAAAQRSKAARMSIGQFFPEYLLTIGYALSGERERARARLPQLNDWPVQAAAVYHVLGEDDKALDLLERALQLRRWDLPNMTSEPLFTRLHDHPRYRAIRRAMQLP
jgi:TolB-like protein/Tfp pilus assembly protein PilF